MIHYTFFYYIFDFVYFLFKDKFHKIAQQIKVYIKINNKVLISPLLSYVHILHIQSKCLYSCPSHKAKSKKFLLLKTNKLPMRLLFFLCEDSNVHSKPIHIFDKELIDHTILNLWHLNKINILLPPSTITVNFGLDW